jgi:hypothetical protein
LHPPNYPPYGGGGARLRVNAGPGPIALTRGVYLPLWGRRVRKITRLGGLQTQPAHEDLWHTAGVVVEDDRGYDIQIATIHDVHCYPCHTYLSSSTTILNPPCV